MIDAKGLAFDDSFFSGSVEVLLGPRGMEAKGFAVVPLLLVVVVAEDLTASSEEKEGFVVVVVVEVDDEKVLPNEAKELEDGLFSLVVEVAEDEPNPEPNPPNDFSGTKFFSFGDSLSPAGGSRSRRTAPAAIVVAAADEVVVVVAAGFFSSLTIS